MFFAGKVIGQRGELHAGLTIVLIPKDACLAPGTAIHYLHLLQLTNSGWTDDRAILPQTQGCLGKHPLPTHPREKQFKNLNFQITSGVLMTNCHTLYYLFNKSVYINHNLL